MVDREMVSDGCAIEDVPDETYTPDGVFDEERTMAERRARPKTLDVHTLRAPISLLGLGEPITIGPEATLAEAVETMQADNFGCVLVVDGGRLIGIFTERDVLQKLAGKGLDWNSERVRDFMTPNPETLDVTANLAFALNLMTIGGFRHVPIVDGRDRPTAVVSMRDVVRYLTSFFEKEVQNLPPRAHLNHPTRREDG